MARDAWQLDERHPAVQRIVELLGDRERTGFPYWMESALWERAGIPAVVIGPAGGGLHTDVEWVELPQLLAYTETLTTLIPAFTRPRRVSSSRSASATSSGASSAMKWP